MDGLISSKTCLRKSMPSCSIAHPQGRVARCSVGDIRPEPRPQFKQVMIERLAFLRTGPRAETVFLLGNHEEVSRLRIIQGDGFAGGELGCSSAACNVLKATGSTSCRFTDGQRKL